MNTLRNLSAFFICALMGVIPIHAQDVIVKRDGTTILSKVLEVNTQDVKYKKYSNLNGPTYTINKVDLLSINYENGDKDIFDEKENRVESQDEHSPKCLNRRVDEERNNDLLSLYSKLYDLKSNVKVKNSAAKSIIVIFGIKNSSVMSNEDIDVTFKREAWQGPEKRRDHIYYINIKNKTNKTIYIDKGNCFKVLHDGTTKTYFDNSEQVTINTGGSNGASLGMGSIAGALGIGGALGQLAGDLRIGGKSSRSVSTTYTQQRLIAIAPHGNKNLSEEKWVKSKDGRFLVDPEYKDIERAESFNLYYENSDDIGLPRGIINSGQVQVFQENDLSWSRDFYLTYSTDEEFKTYSTINFGLFIHQIVGLPRNWVMDDVISDYIVGMNDYTIAGCHWTDH